jgi:mono/diheme cytochrome c family protein
MRLKRILGALAWALAAAVASAFLATGYALFAYRRSWDVPLPPVSAVNDPALIDRGRYIVYGPGRCADCHAPDDERPKLLRGEEAPLTGGTGESTYIGSWTAPNLTSDSATGIGGVTDSQLARMLRYGVNRDGRIAPPFMDSYANLTTEDLVAIISFLRSLPPLPGIPPRAEINVLGKITLAYFLEPYAPSATPLPRLEPVASSVYGDYIANTLAGCRTCHTARNLRTGAYLSPPFSGGLPFRSRLHPGQVYVSPNLTPDPQTGRIANWTEDQFVQRFRAGLLVPDSPMPWGSFTRMTETDLRALYRFLKRLSPVRRDTGPVLQPQRGPAAG